MWKPNKQNRRFINSLLGMNLYTLYSLIIITELLPIALIMLKVKSVLCSANYDALKLWRQII